MRAHGIIRKLLERKRVCKHSLFQKKTFPRQPYHKTTPASDGEDGNNASPGQCPQKGCIAIGREIFLDGSFLFSVWRGYRGAPQTMDFIGGQGDQPFVFSSDMEVLEDFSPLSTNATYWRTCQDTFEGAMPQCLRGDACGGFATGKYSQTIVGKRR